MLKDNKCKVEQERESPPPYCSISEYKHMLRVKAEMISPVKLVDKIPTNMKYVVYIYGNEANEAC